MKNLLTFFFLIWMVSYCSCRVFEGGASRFNVLNYGADGHGKKDARQAFMKAWADFCATFEDRPILEVPAGKTFLLKAVTFSGPCNSTNPHVLIQGNIVAPRSFDAWDDDTGLWIGFTYVSGLVINGGGRIDGQGKSWWKAVKDVSRRPSALHFDKCNDLKLSQLQHVNSQRNHITIFDSTGVEISNLQISAPKDSPNTDGIDISHSKNIHILSSKIETGDDCIAINGFSSYINITNVLCSPGHGISVGSLGKNGAYETVEEVHVKNCTFNETQNGVRIKTWQGGAGYVKHISFEHIRFINSENPIIIDQEYYHTSLTDASRPRPAVQISKITYRDLHGTSVDDAAIKLNCDCKAACTEIVMDRIHITSSTPGKRTYASCNNVHGTSKSAFPKVPCLSNNGKDPY